MSQSTVITEIPLNGIGLEMIYIEGDSFTMGHRGTHEVKVPSFYLGRYPVTNEQFVAFLNTQGNREEGGANWVNLKGNYADVRCGIRKSEDGFKCIIGLEKHPMIYVSWYGAVAYCNWLKGQTGKDFLLPSEAEWEYAARGGKYSQGFLYSGSNKLKEVGWYNANSHQETKPVGWKQCNELGLFDMSGNVREWCADHWHYNYEGAPNDSSAWVTGGERNQRVVRGGSWGNDDYVCTVSNRSGFVAGYRDGGIGFRLARY